MPGVLCSMLLDKETGMSSDKTNKFLMVVIVALLVALIFSVNSSRTVLVAGTSGAAGNVTAVTGNTESQALDLLYVVDTQAKTVCVYQYRGNILNLVAARNIKFDLLLDEWGNTQSPSVKEVYNKVQKKIRGSTSPPKKRR